ncbi:MAG: 50S ribosomal protein L6 [Nanoarchaeota archaeon]
MNGTIIDELAIPEGITISLDNGIFTIKGPKGEIRKDLSYPTVMFEIEGTNILFLINKKKTQREKKLSHTFKARLKNYFRGVQNPHTYKLKVCSGHFPMSINVKGKTFEVKNFIGESVPRTLKIKEGADVTVNGDEVIVTGIDLDVVSQTAADIEKLTRRPGFDKRIFMDGIWITEKDGEALA